MMRRPSPSKPLATPHRRSNKIRSLFVPGTCEHQPENQSWVVEDNMTTTATSFSENRDSTGDLVRDLEDSGYPVDGATGQFVPQLDGLALASGKPGFPPVQPDSAHKTTAPTGNKSTCRGRRRRPGRRCKHHLSELPQR